MPVLFSVLDASPSGRTVGGGFAGVGNWNPHRNAFRNLTDYVGEKWKMELTYQTIPLDRATPEDLEASQVLYLGGRQKLYPDDPLVRRRTAELIREYLERGGFLLAAADDPVFDTDFREWIRLVFPEPGYELRPLPASHPIWRNEEILAADQIRPVYGVEFGCRTSVIYVPCTPERPLSCLWELRPSRRSRIAAQPTYAGSVVAKIQSGLTLGINVLAYATNRRVQGKEEFFDRENAENARDQMARGRLAIASILHGGGCHAAPRALANLLDEAAARLKYRIDADTVELTATDPKIFRYPILFIHGRSDFQFSDEEREALRTYLERGGTILADSVCGSDLFTRSFRDEVAHIVPESPLERIPPDAAIWTTDFGGFDLSRVIRRDVVGTKPDGTLDVRENVGPPELEAIAMNGKYRLFFSPYDLSCALEKADSVDCHGYLRDDAARIALNLVLYGLQM
ncbi:MAG: DUF4159 domain-containing protein, partial [Planctomycetia bacterium]|nr:DUF4159 domain-containing protein [Planctomycetia bacterium]